MWCQEWFTTLYACNLDVEGALASATMIMLQVDNSLFRIGTAILMILEDEILAMDMEELMTVRCLVALLFFFFPLLLWFA